MLYFPAVIQIVIQIRCPRGKVMKILRMLLRRPVWYEMLGFNINVSVQASSTKMRQWNILFIELVPIVICLVYWCYMLKTGGSVHNCLVVTQKIGFVFIVFFLCAYLFFEVRWLCFDMYMCDSIWNQPQGTH